MNFKEMDPKQLKALQDKGRLHRLNPQHQWAYAHLNKVREEAKTKTIAELSRKYNVKNRTMRRWVTGK